MQLDIHVHLHGPIEINISPSDQAPAWGIAILEMLEEIAITMGRIERKENTIMTSVADVQAKADSALEKITADADVGNAVKAVVLHQNDLLADLKAQLDAAIAAGGTPESLQKLSDTIDAITAAETSNAQVVADAVTAGTPVAPPIPPS